MEQDRAFHTLAAAANLLIARGELDRQLLAGLQE